MNTLVRIFLLGALFTRCGTLFASVVEAVVLSPPNGVITNRPSMSEDRAAKVLSLEPPVEVAECTAPYDDGGSTYVTLIDAKGKEFYFARGPYFGATDPRLYEGSGHYRSSALLPKGCKEEQALVALTWYWFNRRYTPAEQMNLRSPYEEGRKLPSAVERERWRDITCMRLLYGCFNARGQTDPLEDELYKLGIKVCDVSEISNSVYRVILHSSVTNLSGLSEQPIVELEAWYAKIGDLTPIARLRLKRLWIGRSDVSDLTPLMNMPLESLIISGTKVYDLSPLKEMKSLKELRLGGAPIQDYGPLRDLNLDLIGFCPTNSIKGIDVIRQMKSLSRIEPYPSASRYTPDRFWERFDSGEYLKKPVSKW